MAVEFEQFGEGPAGVAGEDDEGATGVAGRQDKKS
jgi:hypothetical protein